MTTHPRVPRNGKTIAEAAKLTGLSPRTIRRWTSEPREVYLGRAAERREKIHELREKGLSMRAIAEEVGIAVSAVHYALHKDQEKKAS